VANLRVDYSVLHGTRLSLAAIAEEFEQLHQRRNDEARIWGGAQIRHQMNEFASNWDRHREDLTNHLQKLGTHCGAIADTFRSVDEALASARGHERT
jgi:uncharacterized protein YukE